MTPVSLPPASSDDEPLEVGVASTRAFPVARYGAGRSMLVPAHLPSVDEPPLLGLGELRAFAGFPWRAVRRNARRALICFGAVVGVTLLLALVQQRHYRIETRFIAAQNVVMPALGNPRRSVPNDVDAPTRQASEAVLRRENLVQLIHETNLMATFDASRSPLGRLRDAMMRMVRGPMADSDRVNALVGLLEKRLSVESNDRVISIAIDWMDPVTGYRIVQAAQRNFFDQRHASAVAMIGESIAILQGHVASAQQSIDSALAQIRQFEPRRRSGAASRMAAVPAARRTTTTPEIASLRAELSAQQQAIADLESVRRQRMTALETRLTELHNSYGPAHPEVISTQELLRAMSSESPQLQALRASAAATAASLQRLGVAADGASDGPADRPMSRASLDLLAIPPTEANEDPRLTYAKSRLRLATTEYGDLLDRLEAANIELETVRAAFKYQYNVITPAQIPKTPAKPSIPLLLVGGFILALVSSVFVAVASDLSAGRLTEPWQVSRLLSLPILAEIDRT